MDLINTAFLWLAEHPALLMGLGITSIFIFILSLVGVSWFVALIPEDYFTGASRRSSKFKENAPLLSFLLLIAKNLLGFCLILGGFLMIVLPGQGLLTIITGLFLINYPGKFQLEQKIVTIPAVFKALNWIRLKAKKPPLKRNSHI
ncbi:hypothetical protein N9I84_02515 [Gammaproteobacteria bacterium]|nr:hypothetical protein [Gammaproteobacteria bacterium]MDA8924936.1 hypothetical protein [Gammaproteobacteria bacterium]MDA9048834.1 hypothetical protein [Gammaproteobacteria bacterium]MDA9154464.1 hypothetical protein [Gammaproteobacteria bacterium]MDA9371076.1 hypothetical protein [Gammaproteobacteria bacterium]|tara:strand:- start:2983 stop:3420 length:438 start_codon:yes stop_codon:yes gene_type:complete